PPTPMVRPERKRASSSSRTDDTPTSPAASTSLLIASSERPRGERRSTYEAASAITARASAYQYSWYFRFACTGNDMTEDPPVSQTQYVQMRRGASPTPMVEMEE